MPLSPVLIGPRGTPDCPRALTQGNEIMGVFTKLGEGIGDLAQLNVRTFTGDITGMLPAAGKKSGTAAASADSYDFDVLSLIGMYDGVEYEPISFSVEDPNDDQAPHFSVEEG